MDDATRRTIILLLTLILPVLGNWFSNGFPTDRTSLGYLGAALVTAFLVFLERWSEKSSLKKQCEVEKEEIKKECETEKAKLAVRPKKKT